MNIEKIKTLIEDFINHGGVVENDGDIIIVESDFKELLKNIS